MVFSKLPTHTLNEVLAQAAAMNFLVKKNTTAVL